MQKRIFLIKHKPNVFIFPRSMSVYHSIRSSMQPITVGDHIDDLNEGFDYRTLVSYTFEEQLAEMIDPSLDRVSGQVSITFK